MKKPAKKKTPTKRKYSCKAVELLRWQRFAHKYIELNYNGTQAYLAVYGEDYELKNNRKMTNKVANSAASKLLSKVAVQDIIEKSVADLMAQEQITAGKVLSRYDKWAKSDITDILEWSEVTLKDKDGIEYSSIQPKLVPIKDLTQEQRNSIKSISFTKEGFKLELVDKKGSNDMLAKFLNLDKEEEKSEREIHIHFDATDKALL